MPSETPTGTYRRGVAIAIVTSNKDPEGLRRVRIRYPWHDDSSASYWARIVLPMVAKERGSVLIPEVGEEVLVAFEGDDIGSPHILGLIY